MKEIETRRSAETKGRAVHRGDDDATTVDGHALVENARERAAELLVVLLIAP